MATGVWLRRCPGGARPLAARGHAALRPAAPRFSTAVASTSAASAPGHSAALLLGRVDGPRASAVLQQSNAILAKLRGSGQVTAQQIVEALQRLAAVARGAPAADLEALSGHPGLRQLLADLVQQLPRDAGEEVEWDRAWTSRVVGALQELRLPGAALDPRLSVRLGHTLVQASGDVELEKLLHAVCALCALDRTGSAPDDYTLWVLGQRLEELCAGRAPGDLDLAKLVELLHLLAHPAIRGRVADRGSVAVLRHVHHGLAAGACGPGAVAKLLQAYSDVPNLVTDALLALGRGGGPSFDALQLPELAAVASALPPRLRQAEARARAAAADVAPLLLRRLRVIADAAAAADAPSAELLLLAAGRAVEQLAPAADGDAWEAVGAVLASVGSQAAASLQEAPVEALAELVRLELACAGALPREGVDAAAASARLRAAAEALAPHAAELPAGHVVDLASALARSVVEAPPALFEALRLAAEARAGAFSTEEFCSLARSFASAGLPVDGLLEAADVEAVLTRSPSLPALAALAWSLAALGAERPLAWRLVGAALDARRGPELSALPVEEKVMLYEALRAWEAVSGEPWPPGSAAGEVCADAKAAEAWSSLCASAPASTQADLVARLLGELGYAFRRDVAGQDGLYTMPFLLEDQGLVLDVLAKSPRHPASHETMGSVMLRHVVWSAGGSNILAVPDTMWEQLGRKAEKSAAEDGAGAAAAWSAQLAYLQRKVDGIHRADVFKTAELQEATIRQLDGIRVGHGGLNRDALQRLQAQPALVRERCVEKFRKSLKESVRNQSAWMIGIISHERDYYDKEQEKRRLEEQQRAAADDGKSQSVAATRPAGGWTHSDGRPVEDAKPGEKVSGTITNVWHGRVWVDAGFEKDVTFKAAPGMFKVGETLRNLQVAGLSAERQLVEVHAPKPDLRHRARRGSRRADGEEGGGERAPRGKAALAAGAPPTSAATERPTGGWTHRGARPLGDLHVGEVVSGTVTNVLYDRVWIDVGAERDASFWKPGHAHKVGDAIEGLRITSVGLKKGHLLVAAPGARAPRRAAAAARS